MVHYYKEGGGRQRIKQTKFNGGKRRSQFIQKSREASALARENASKIANMRTGGFEGMENKFADFTVSDDAFSLTWAGGEMEDGTALSVSAVAQGDGESQRDGRVYYINSVHIKGFVKRTTAEQSATPLPDVLCRIALVWDTQTNGAQLNAEDVFKTIASTEDVNSFRNLQFSKRFIVLKDKHIRVHLDNQTNEGAIDKFACPDTIIPFTINKKFSKPIKVRCTGTTAAISSISDNSLHIIGTAQTASLQLTYESRVRFTG